MGQYSEKDPLYRRIADTLRAECRWKYRPGQRFPGDAELSARFGVCGVTVRQAIFALVEEGLLIRRQGSGTYVAEVRDDRHVAIVTEADVFAPRSSHFTRMVISSLRRLMARQRMRHRVYVGLGLDEADPFGPVDLASLCESSPDLLEDVSADRIRGAVVIACEPRAVWYDVLRRRNVPVVGGSTVLEWRAAGDEAGAMRLAVRRAAGAGRRRIALLDWESPMRRAAPVAGHGAVFADEMRRAGLAVHSEWVRHDVHPLSPGAGWAEFREIWAARAEKPDALIITDDAMVADALAAVLELGIRVPEDLLIVAKCNRGAALYWPLPVARIEFDTDAYAAVLFELLVESLRGEREPRTVTVPYVCEDVVTLDTMEERR